jgi:putative membrane protein
LSDLNDPRVLFAAECTLLAWNRTASGLIALGFFIERASLITEAAKADRGFAVWIGIAFLLLGVLLGVLSVVQYRRSVASLRPVGLLLALYLLRTL